MKTLNQILIDLTDSLGFDPKNHGHYRAFVKAEKEIEKLLEGKQGLFIDFNEKHHGSKKKK